MNLGTLGCGKMGTTLIGGAIRAGIVTADQVIGCDPVAAARESFTQLTAARTTSSAAEMANACEVIFLCTLPPHAAEALRAAAHAAAGQPRLVISIAAGITLAALEAACPENFRVIRAMPNTPALVGKGAAGYCLGTRATPADAATAQMLLEAVGLAIEMPERFMNLVTGLSGSGPAYVYVVIEALADGGVLAGLTRAVALRLAAQTVLGAAAMVLETNEHPAVLKDKVTSPGGTTIAGLAELERLGLRSALIAAVSAASRRAEELGHQ
ncbi:MAG: pyrroline-5-carboxylate reductase [Verrucomicrobiota bacterium]